ncbi:hypothetical protein AOQ84DRAFT_226296 [Glonium stellatum]|uniref:Uncharacterized protein n=1 Tax=Glonium stellatum TaxID=574774 RepID=A0A8E2ET33_9PEZI|nr:hypothetical protein AOQ84DRAFT_226296 [Glonium stellatum]
MTHIPWTNNDNIDPVNSNLDVVVNLDTNDSTIILVHPVPASRFIGTTTEDLLRIRQHLLANPELKSITHQGGGFYVRPEIMVRSLHRGLDVFANDSYRVRRRSQSLLTTPNRLRRHPQLEIGTLQLGCMLPLLPPNEGLRDTLPLPYTSPNTSFKLHTYRESCALMVSCPDSFVPNNPPQPHLEQAIVVEEQDYPPRQAPHHPPRPFLHEVVRPA